MQLGAIAPGARAVSCLSLCLLACSTTTRSGSVANESHPSGQRGEITRKEIQATLGQAVTACDLIKRLRPAMLLRRPVDGIEQRPSMAMNELAGAHVHVDDVRIGDFDFLATIPANAVIAIRWLSPHEASTRYGNGHTAGVIAVTTATGRW